MHKSLVDKSELLPGGNVCVYVLWWTVQGVLLSYCVQKKSQIKWKQELGLLPSLLPLQVSLILFD